MSKLLDKIDKASQPIQRRMGFAITKDEVKVPPMILILRLEEAGLLKDAPQASDAVILQVTALDVKSGPIKEMGQFPESYPWGVQTDAIQPEEIEGLLKAGCDYMVFGIEGTPAPVLNEEDIGKVLCIGISLEEELVRVLDEVPVEAILIDSEPEDGLTIKGLMAYRSVVYYASKPVLVRIPLGLSEGELTALQNAGIAGIVVEPRTASDMKQVSRLRKAIESLPPREAGETPRIDALVPPASSALADEEE